MFGPRPRPSDVGCRGRNRRRVRRCWSAPGVVVVIRGGRRKDATAAFAYSVLVAVENPADAGPRSRRPISRDFGWDVGFNRWLVQSDWKALHVSAIPQRRSRKNKKSASVAPSDCAVAYFDKRCGSSRLRAGWHAMAKWPVGQARALGTGTYRRPILLDSGCQGTSSSRNQG